MTTTTLEWHQVGESGDIAVLPRGGLDILVKRGASHNLARLLPDGTWGWLSNREPETGSPIWLTDTWAYITPPNADGSEAIA